MKIEWSRKKSIVSASLLCLLSFALTVFFIYRFEVDNRLQTTEALAKGHEETKNAAQKIDRLLQGIETTALKLAEDLSSGALEKSRIVERLRQLHDQAPEIYGIGVAFAPYAYDGKTRLFAPYMTRPNGVPKFVQIEKKYDYLAQRYDWYALPKENGPCWMEPFYGEASQAMLAEFCTPFFQAGQERSEHTFAGIVYINYSLGGLQKMVNELELGKTGYGFILSQEGRVASHPSEELVKGGKTIFELAEERSDQTLALLAKRASGGETGVVDHVDLETGRSSWYFFNPIPTTEWSMGAVFVKEEVLNNPDKVRRQLFLICASIILTLFALVMLLASFFYRWDQTSLLIISIAVSIILVGAVVSVWAIALRYPPEDLQDPVKIVDRSGLDHYLGSYSQLCEKHHEEPPIFIPTGAFIQSIEFLGANNVLVTGYVWQKYLNGEHDGLSRGFVLPEAEEVSITEAYRFKENGHESIGWYFKATLREHFDYSHYPFDREKVWLRFWHEDFDRNVVLTPDLASYKMTNPGSRPGIEQDFVLPGWVIEGSFFSYRTQSYNTNFGIERYVGQENFPELYFNVQLKRQFLDPFLSKLVPLLVVSIMLYATFLVVTKEGEKVNLTGFNVLSVVASCAALFFVVIFDHISLRERLEAPGVVYLEYFYFIMYIALLSVSVNSVLFVSNYNIRLLEYRDNLLSKMVFWPAIYGSIFIVTWSLFY